MTLRAGRTALIVTLAGIGLLADGRAISGERVGTYCGNGFVVIGESVRGRPATNDDRLDFAVHTVRAGKVVMTIYEGNGIIIDESKGSTIDSRERKWFVGSHRDSFAIDTHKEWPRYLQVTIPKTDQTSVRDILAEIDFSASYALNCRRR